MEHTNVRDDVEYTDIRDVPNIVAALRETFKTGVTRCEEDNYEYNHTTLTYYSYCCCVINVPRTHACVRQTRPMHAKLRHLLYPGPFYVPPFFLQMLVR